MKNAHERALRAARRVYAKRQHTVGTNACFKHGVTVQTGTTEYAVDILTPFVGDSKEVKTCYSGDDMIKHLLSKNKTMEEIAEIFEWMLGVVHGEGEDDYAEKVRL